eukprot:3841172-Rhodomonas_salina.2
MKTLAGHRGAVTAIFPDENTLYTGARDGVIRVWDLRVRSTCRMATCCYTSCSALAHCCDNAVIADAQMPQEDQGSHRSNHEHPLP